MKIVLKDDRNKFFTFDSTRPITLPAGRYMVAYRELTNEEWGDGERFDNLSPDFAGEIETEGDYTVLKPGAAVEFRSSGYNDYDRCDPYILRFPITIT